MAYWRLSASVKTSEEEETYHGKNDHYQNQARNCSLTRDSGRFGSRRLLFDFGRGHYFLKRLSNAARASSALRGAADTKLGGETLDGCAEGKPSRATVTQGRNNSHGLA